MGQIQKQGIINTIITYIGFIFGFINVIILYPILFSKEQFGLTRLYNDLGGTFAVFASFGVTSAIPRFLPQYIKDKSKDLIPIALIVAILGAFVLTISVFIFKQQIFDNYCENNILFRQYAYLILFMGICNTLFNVLATYSNCSYNTNVVSFVTQLLTRIFPTFLLILVYFKVFNFVVFIHLYATLSFIQLVIILFSLYKNNLLDFNFKISITTKQFKNSMFIFSGSIFIMLIIGTLSNNLQVFTISDMKGVDNTAIFVIASYISQIIQIPQLSIAVISTPIISTAWHNNDIEKIKSIYIKSSINMNIAGLFLFLLIYLNIHNLFYLIGKNYDAGINITIFMGIANLIDLSFGINNEIISTSKYWKFNLITHICLIILMLPTNYFFIKHFGTIGAAYSLILSLTIYNTWRMFFLYFKYKMLPFSIKTAYLIIYSIFLFFCLKFLFGYFSIQFFKQNTINSISEMSLKTIVVTLLYIVPIYIFKISEDFNSTLNTLFIKIGIKIK